MIPETLLFNYGVLGIWTVVLLYDRYNFQRDLKHVIERNTEALIDVKHVKIGCPTNRFHEVLKNGN